MESELLESLLAYCDVDGDGQINYAEFANFLNWKDKMLPEGMHSTKKESEEGVKVSGKSILEMNNGYNVILQGLSVKYKVLPLKLFLL